MSHVHTPRDSRIFVFGSNLLGIHGAGAAKYALDMLGARWGAHEGLHGQSYALPTCSEPGVPLPLEQVEFYVTRFLAHARAHKQNRYFVSEVGCGLAGFTSGQIMPYFRGAPLNCDLPPGWPEP